MTFDEELKQALDTLSLRLQGEVVRQVAAMGAAATGGEPLPSTDLLASERMLTAIRTIDRATSLREVLDTLVSAAGREASRVALVLVRGDEFQGWRFIGFGPALDTAARIDISRTEAGALLEAAASGAIVSGDGGAAGRAPGFANLPPGLEYLAVPITMAGEVVAVLYADQGGSLTWPTSVEVLTRHAGRCLEALTAIKAARALTERPQAPVPMLAETDEEQVAARRYARLLTSEIKLYHEPEVIAGRRERDLATRLGGEIARARALYEQRVSADVRHGIDYFQAELVRTLANGDASLLESRDGRPASPQTFKERNQD
jgi:hypothetical protein